MTLKPISAPLRFVLIVAVFVLVGPPVGGLVAWLGVGAQSLRSPVSFLTGGYAEGTALALGTGLLAASASIAGLRSWLVPILAALLMNALLFLATTGPDLSNPEHVAGVMRADRVFLPPSLIAAIVCWALSGRLLRP